MDRYERTLSLHRILKTAPFPLTAARLRADPALPRPPLPPPPAFPPHRAEGPDADTGQGAGRGIRETCVPGQRNPPARAIIGPWTDTNASFRCTASSRPRATR